MPWRLIGIIAISVILLLFIGFNIENECALSLGLYTFERVPVYLTVFISFMLGMLFSLPFVFIKKKSQKAKSAKTGEKPSETSEKLPEAGGKLPDIADGSHGTD
jgi:uncharacterized integral membrane protein